jgi:outer membrane protein TolC
MKDLYPSLLFALLLPAMLGAQPSLAGRIFPDFYIAAERQLEDTESLTNALFSEERAEADLQLRRSGMLPSVGSYAQYHFQNEDFDPPLGDQDSERFLYGLALRQPLYHWGSLRANHQIGKILLEQSKRNTRETRQILQTELLRRALGYYLALKDHEFAQVMLKHYARVLEITEESVHQGVATLVELENIRQHHRNATQNQIRSLTTKLRLHHQFLKDFSLPQEILGTIPSQVSHDIQMDLPYWEKQIHDFIETGFQQHPHFLNVLSTIQVQEQQVAALRSGNRPNLDLVIGANQDDTSYLLNQLDDRFRQTYYAGLRVNWNIFDGKATEARINTARIHLKQAQRQKEFASLYLAQEARHILHELQNADIRLKSLKMTLDHRAERHQQTVQSHKNGQVPNSELDNTAYDLSYHQHLYHFEYIQTLSHMLNAELITSFNSPEVALEDRQ